VNGFTKNDVKKTPFPGVTVTGNAVVIAGDSVSIKENKECEHEFRTYSVYSPEHSRTLGSSECRKCGELYR